MTSPAQTDPAAWFAITQMHFGDPVYWPMVQAAGRVAEQAIAFAGTDVATPGGRDLHSRVAMATYQQLREQEARLFPAGHPLAERPQCALNREQLRNWLVATTTGTQPAVAKRLRLDDTLHADGPNVAARLARLIDAAQADGMFGVPGHEIRLWHGGDPDIYADGYFITIQPPSGPALARGPLTDADLLGRNARGVEAGLNALNHVGRVANAVLAEQHSHLRAVHAAANASTGPPQPHTSSAHRAFAAPPTQLRAPAGEAPPSPTAPTELRPSQHR